jgi:glycerol-3-phosphate acyltransferase PlsY
MQAIFLAVICYLLGSIPFSYLFSKLKGKDPRKGGTGNVGASNAMIVAGPIIAVLSMFGDIAKGSAAVILARYFNLTDWGIVLCGLMAIVGHDFPVFLGFKGGKGVATTGGVLLVLNPFLSFLLILLWGLTMAVTRYFIPSTILILASLPFMMWISFARTEYIFFAVGALLLGLFAHRNDIERFLDGKELSISDSLAKYLKKT